MNRDLMIIVSVSGFWAGCLALFYSAKLPSLAACIYLLICVGLLIRLVPKDYFSVVLYWLVVSGLFGVLIRIGGL